MSKYVHSSRCKCGRNQILNKGDAWYIVAPEYYNCFWTYLRYNTRQHTLSEIAELLGLSISAITSIEKKATSKLRSKINLLTAFEQKE